MTVSSLTSTSSVFLFDDAFDAPFLSAPLASKTTVSSSGHWKKGESVVTSKATPSSLLGPSSSPGASDGALSLAASAGFFFDLVPNSD